MKEPLFCPGSVTSFIAVPFNKGSFSTVLVHLEVPKLFYNLKVKLNYKSKICVNFFPGKKSFFD